MRRCNIRLPGKIIQRIYGARIATSQPENSCVHGGRLRFSTGLADGFLRISSWVVVVGVLVTAGGTSLHAQTSVEGEWSTTLPFNNTVGIHATLLPTEKVIFWGWDSSSKLWDPVSGQFSDIGSQTPNDILCAGHAWLPDGRLLVVGGDNNSAADIFDPFNNTWANSDADLTNDVPDMNGGRWYPSATTLGNGDVLVMSGQINTLGPINNTLPQVYEFATNSWRDLTTAIKTLPTYPRTFLTPDGGVVALSLYGDYFDSVFEDTTDIIDVTGTGSWSFVDNTLASDMNAGSAVMYDAGKVAFFGGGTAPTANIALLDLNNASPQWTYAANPMAQPRRQHDATILADGTVLITGGTSGTGFNDPNGALAATEIWDPVTGSVTQVADADASVYRGYHSAATLLSDGRVLITGSNGEFSAQIYSPAYLFNGDRPSVTSAPSVVQHGETFFVETPDAANIEDVVWIVPGSTTHAQNWTQRADHLEFIEVAGGLEITVPSNPNEAPPGYYMLFLINDNGVPSVADWVQATVVPEPTSIALFAPLLGLILAHRRFGRRR